MVTLIVFECVDVTATLAAAWLLLRAVVAHPALGRAPHVVAVPVDDAEEIAAPVELPGDVSEPADDGISWPVPAWSGLMA